MSLASSYTTPAANIVTTAETVAQNVPPTGFQQYGGVTGVIVRGNVVITAGTGVTSVSVKLRTGQNNTTTGQVGQTETAVAVASTLITVPFTFVDTSAPVGSNLASLGYSVTVTQNAATGNGTVTAVNYEVDRAPV